MHGFVIVTSFAAAVEAALDAAQEVEWDPKQVVVLKDTPILHSMLTPAIGPECETPSH